MNRLLLLFFVLAVVTSSCVTSKSLSKKGKILEDAGQYTAAADLYYQSILKKNTNTDALIGMNRTGKQVLNKYLEVFSKYVFEENYEKATYAYMDALAYQKKLKGVNIDIPISQANEDKYKDARTSYLSQKYDEGLKFIELERFPDAEKCFNEVYKFDQNFKDVNELRNIAYLEPYYRKAEKYKDDKEYRKAYDAYNRILSRVGNYKDTKEHLNYVLKKGQIGIAITNDKKSRYYDFSKTVKQYVLNDIIKIRDPFVKIVDRDNIDEVIKEQELALSGMVNSDDQLEVGEISGVKYSVIIDVSSYGVDYRPLKKTAKKGYESYKVKYKDSETGKTYYKTKYKKITYYIYTSYRKVSMTINYKILSLSTGEILGTDIIRKAYESDVEYAIYDGSYSKLYPSYDGKVNTSYSAHNNLKRKFTANKTLASVDELRALIYKNSSSTISNSIINKFK